MTKASKHRQHRRLNKPSPAGTIRQVSKSAAIPVPTKLTEFDQTAIADASAGYWRVGLALLLSVIFAWSYWPTLVDLVSAWYREPDYSHGFLVVPLVAWFLWVKRDAFPGVSRNIAWMGAVVVGVSLALRLLSVVLYIDALDGLSIIVWVAGVVWLLFGRPVMRWSLPAIAFLLFMVPLPFRIEHTISLPLQRIATNLSCLTLQLLGQPAIAEGNTILVGDTQLEVAQACSGLRIFMGVIALAFITFILIRRQWWEKLIVLASVIPIALVVNAARIVGTAILYQYASDADTKELIHTAMGRVMMIPLAAALFGLVLWYLGKIIKPVHQLDVGSIIRHEM